MHNFLSVPGLDPTNASGIVGLSYIFKGKVIDLAKVILKETDIPDIAYINRAILQLCLVNNVTKIKGKYFFYQFKAQILLSVELCCSFNL